MIKITINSITEKNSVIQTITVNVDSGIPNDEGNVTNKTLTKKGLLDAIDSMKELFEKKSLNIPIDIKTKYGKNVNIVNGKSGRYFRTDGDKNPNNDLIDLIK